MRSQVAKKSKRTECTRCHGDDCVSCLSFHESLDPYSKDRIMESFV